MELGFLGSRNEVQSHVAAEGDANNQVASEASKNESWSPKGKTRSIRFFLPPLFVTHLTLQLQAYL